MIELAQEVFPSTVTNERQMPRTLEPLARLRWNYWWSWAADGAAVFRDLDPETWEQCEHNPHRLLREVPEFRFMQMATDPQYIKRVAKLAESFDEYMSANEANKKKSARTWAERTKEVAKTLTHNSPVAYFCAEYGVHNSLPLYSGGLGMLAGDHLKSASDLGLPLVAVGLLYRHGYFRQQLSRDGWQEEVYGEVPPSDLPLHLVQDGAGEPLVVEVMMRGRMVGARVWRASIGRISLYLLDTNIESNNPVDRWVTGHLYGGDRETRIVQELMLGVGGVRLLRRLGVAPHVFHLNEGHSAFLTLELTRELVAQGTAFDDAKRQVRARCVFTTHTPVAAGNDEFQDSTIDECLGESYWASLNLSRDEFFALGRVCPDDEREAFGMTPLAIKMCRSTNGVSRKHGEVSRSLWHEMWKERSVEEVPITSVTNGVHAPTWVAPLIRALYEKHIGKDWAETIYDPAKWRKGVARISDEELWQAHSLLKERLVAFVRHRTFHQRARQSDNMAYAEAARTMFEPSALTIGFARRIAAYKRWGLLLTDPERLHRLLTDKERPVQFVFAGKAHPQDMGAKIILQQLATWKLDREVMSRAVFLQDYDQEIARQLVQSVDVWMNVPRRPLEASGTSGQKVGMNGGLNFSILDGWWIEGYEEGNGWAIGREEAEVPTELDEAAQMEGGASDTAREDRDDAESLYRVLEEGIVPTYYERAADGLPRRWLKMMRRSIETLAPAFNSDRMVQDYARQIYIIADIDSMGRGESK